MESESKVCPKCGRRFPPSSTFCQRDGTRLQAATERSDRYVGATLLDQFQIVERIGAGGMGAVYRARQTTLDREVAIKILHPELADNEDAVRRFRREARVSTALDHPNVVRVFLFGQLPDGSLYIVMELLQGRALLDVLHDDGEMPVHRALHIATQVCDGVGEAHAHGVVHRDIKPENIVLIRKRRDPDFVKVLDFGIARVLWGNDETIATQTGLVFGTARYISPEGAAGEPTDVRSDVYSLGVLTYQLLSGETPFEAPSPVAMLMKHIHAPAPHIRSRRGGRQVPPAVAEVVMEALSKDPAHRPADATALADALRAAAARSGFQVQARSRVSSILPSPDSAVAPVPYPPSAAPPGSISPTPRMNPHPSFGVEPTFSPPPGGTASMAPAGTPTHPASRPAQQSATLASAPSPFDTPVPTETVPGLRGSRSSGLLRPVVLAFLAGVLLVAGGLALAGALSGPPAPDLAAWEDEARAALEAERLDEPTDESVLSWTDRILAVDPEHEAAQQLREEAAAQLRRQAEATEPTDRDAAAALYGRAQALAPDDEVVEAALARLALPPPPALEVGVGTEPERLVEGRRVRLVAVVPEGTPAPEGSRPRFVIKRGRQQLGRSQLAELADGETRVFVVEGYRFRWAGSYDLIFRIGRGDSRYEERIQVRVERDPARARRAEEDPPPVTTQGGVWQPSIVPAWQAVEPLVEAATEAATGTPPRSDTTHSTVTPPPTPVVDPEPDPEPPPPPEPWTGSL